MDDLVNTVVGTVKEGISESIEAHASAEDLQARVDALKNENDQLKRAAYEAERNVKELQKKKTNITIFLQFFLIQESVQIYIPTRFRLKLQK
jgi:FtsZ-binding cell division protein ZapB